MRTESAGPREDLRARLQSALGAAYLVERELGGGGMSRVFVALDKRLDRRVVVKVLHAPDLGAGLSPERFEREVRVAARLQHPNVVPLLTAGDAAGVPYYTMPFVDGESLRARLARGPIPLGEAMRALRDVAQALAYAHAHGVVHRDIKPENVLLGEHGAVVADFGIAKALTVARTRDDGAVDGRQPGAQGTLTQVGVSLGTPAYMAPEQAAGEAVDGRADLYAWAVVAYEALAGRHPFAHVRGARQLLAAQLGEAPTPLVDVAPGVPPALAAVVTQCLAKDPAARPSSAATVLAAIDAAGGAAMPTAPAPGRAPPSARGHRRRWWGATTAAVLAVAAGAVAATRVRSPADDGAAGEVARGLVVADFANHAGDSTTARAVTQVLRDDLAQSPRVAVPAASDVREELAAMRADSAGALTGELALALARRRGDAAVLDGAVYATGSGYVLTARLVAAEDGRPVATFREPAANASQLIDAIDRLSRAVRREVGESAASLRATPPLYAATTRSWPALVALTRMVEAQRDGDLPAAVEHGRQAVSLDPEFAEAHRRLANALGNMGIRRAERVAAVSRAYELRARLSPYEQGAVEANYHSTVRGDHRRAAERLGVLAAEYPASADRRRLSNPLGNLSAAYRLLGEWDRALEAIRPEAESPNGRVHHALALIGLGRLGAADSVVRAIAPDPAERWRVAYLRTVLSAARRDHAGALAHVDSALAAAEPPPNRIQLLGERRAAAATLGRLGVRARTDAALMREYVRLGAADPELLRMAAELALVEAAVGAPERAVSRLDSALARHPLAPIAALDRPYAALAAAWAGAGQPGRAEALLAEWARTVPVENQPLDAIPILRARILTRLAQGRAAEAERLARDGFFGPCGGCRDVYLARAFDARGNADSTLAAYERYLAATFAREATDPTEVARAYRRLGELYEARGDVRRAMQRYGDFVELWQGADAALQPAVDEVRRRIRQLQSRAG